MGEKPNGLDLVPKRHTIPEDGVWSPARESEYFYKHWSGNRLYNADKKGEWILEFIDGHLRFLGSVKALRMAYGRKKKEVN